MSAFTRSVTLLCFVVLGHTAASAQGGCPGGSCSITCPPDISLCLATDNYGETAITADWVASHTSSPNPACDITRVWKDAMGMEELTEPIMVDCDEVGDHVTLWVSREKYLWPECRSSLVKVRVHIKDCEPPAVACPPMGMFVCNEDVPRPGVSLPFPFSLVWPGYKLINQATFQSLGGSASDACGLDGVIYKDELISVDPVCKTNRTIKRTFIVFDVNGNHKSCTQEIVVADNEAPTFDANPADLTLNCDAAGKAASITAWLNVNTNPGNQSGPDAVVTDRCDENVVTITAVPSNAATILAQMPEACDPNPREVTVVFTANDGCGNQATRSAKVRLIDNVPPTVPMIPDLTVQCDDEVPPAPNTDVVVGESDNCTPSDKLKVELVSTAKDPGSCPNKYVLRRTYHITDCSGNTTTRTHTIRVNDTTIPTWDPNPQSKFMMDVCDPAALLTQINEWLDDGYGRAKDNCDVVNVTANKTAMQIRTELLDFCDPNSNVTASTVVFTATDACGNTSSRSATIRLMDSKAPEGTPPPAATFSCQTFVPAMSTAQVTNLTDNCTSGSTVVVTIESNPTPGYGCADNPNVIIRRWRLTDCAGNTRILSQVITVKDDVAPVWNTFPSDLSVSCSNANLGNVIQNWLDTEGYTGSAADACDGVSYSHQPTNVNDILKALGKCQPYNGETTVTFIAKDACGNTSTATAKVTVYDNTPPTASAQDDTYSCQTEVPGPDASVINDENDNCTPAANVSVTFLPNATQNNGGKGCMGDPLIVTRWYKLEDCAGNTASVSHQITVVDMTAPQAIAQSITKYLDEDCSILVNASEFNNGSFDNCGIKKIEIRRGDSGPWFAALSFTGLDIPNLEDCGAFHDNSQIITIQMRVTDNCDQTDITTTTITLVDNTPPTIECPDDMTVYTSENGGYDCKATATWTHPIPTDNCAVGCMTMEVQKMINGVFVTVNPNNNFPTPNYRTDVFNDQGEQVSYLFGKGPYCTDNQYKIIYRVRDVHGNTKPEVTCSFIITIKDDEAPEWNNCPESPIVAQTVTGDCYQMKCWTRPTAYDNCEYPGGPCPAPTVVVTTSDPTVMVNQVGDEDCALFPVGTTYVYYTATDAEGNVSTCTVTVEISDPQAPVAMCAGPFTVNMEPDGVMQLSVADIDAPGTMDNCGICFKGVSRNPNCCFGPTVNLTCADVGTVVRVYMRVRDCSVPGNEATCYSDVTVQDMQSPGVAFCPQDITVGTDNNVCNAKVNYNAPLFNDGCSSPKAGTLIQGLPSGSTFPIGVTHVQYCYTSASGYTVCCDFNVTVEDDQAPSITCPADVVNLTCLQTLPAPLAATAFDADPVAALSDNCGVTALDFSDYDNDLTHCAYDGIRTIIRTYTAWDAAGNSATCQQKFQYVEDTQKPELAVKPTDLPNLKCADEIPPVPVQSATDNCGTVNIDFSEEVQPNGCENKLVIIRRWVATDLCGNTDEWEQTITVNDDVDPVLEVTPLNTQYDCAEDVEAAPKQIASDNCGVVYVDFYETVDAGLCPNQYVIMRRWVATDLCGNTAEHWQMVTVNDDEAPKLEVTPLNRQFDCAEDVEAAPKQIFSDNCGVVFVDFYETVDPQGCPNKYTIMRRWVATDLCGNTAEHWQMITVNDDEPPVLLTTPLDMPQLKCADDVPPAPVGNATDNCGVVFVDFSESTTPGDCQNQFVVVRRWVATDLCGNTDEHWQTITVYDNVKPQLAVKPLDVRVDCSEKVPPVPVQTATDNCEIVYVDFSEEIQPGGCEDKFVVIRTWVATDLCGNTDKHVWKITVDDSEAPEWEQDAPDNPTVECSEDVPPMPLQTATDNCGVAVTLDIVETTEPGTCPNQYVVIRTWTAQDACGNVTTRQQVVTVSDTEAPTWNQDAPDSPLAFECSEDVPAIPEQTASDNCDVPVDVEFYETYDLGTCPNSFVLTRVWTAEDDCGNATTRIQVITVSDTEAPVWDQDAPESPVNVECSEDVPAVPEQTATDNCSVPVDINFNEVIDWGTCSNKFTVIRTWTAADDCGNITTRVQVINVNDDEAPVLANLPDAEVHVDCADDVPAVAPVTVSDNCTPPVFFDFSEVEAPGACPNRYTITRTWFAQDDCGNSTIFVQTIHVFDEIDPVVTAPAPITLDCGDISETTDPSAQITDWLAAATATDNCDQTVDITYNYDATTLDVCVGGTLTVTWTATDHCGNTGIATSTITVVPDTEKPVITVPAPLVLDCGDISETADPAAQIDAWIGTASATDNCDTDPELSYSFNMSELNICAPATYTITVTWTANDACGNSTQKTQTITVIPDTEKPSITVPAPLVLDCGDISETADPSAQIADWLASASATDNCDTDPELNYDFNIADLNICAPATYTITVTWTANDACNNSTQKTQTITVIPDTEKPSITVPAPLVLDCGDINETTDPSAQILDWLAAASATDNCDTDPELNYDFNISMLNVCAPATYTITVTWTANDACNNTTQKSQTITVIPDTEDPVVNAPAPITLDCGDISETSDPSAIVADWLAAATATDNCDTDPALTYDFDVTTLDVCVGGTLTVTWTAVDHCGNAASATSTITVVPDTEDPVVTAPAPITLDCGDISETNDPAAVISNWLASATATDNCDTDPAVTYNFDATSLNVCVGGTLTVTWTATDHCGNVGTAVSTITVVPDTEDPIVSAPAPLTLDCDDLGPITDPAATVLNWLESASASDNCDTDPELTYNFDITTLNVCVGGTLTVTWTSTDACGNVGTATSTITVVPDTEAPQLVGTPAAAVVNVTCAADVPALATGVTATDNCIAPVDVEFSEVQVPGSCLNKFTLIRTWSATDACGNATQFVQTINVNDNVAPVMSCPAPLFAQCSPGEHPPYANLTEFTTAGGSASDNCGLNVNSFGLLSEVQNGNVYTRTYRVIDQCGNSATCTQTVTVIDTQKPVFLNCPVGPLVFGNDPDKCSAKINWPAPVAVDNCSIPTVVQTSGPTAGSVVPVGTYTVVFTATDAAGNVAVCSFVVMVMDTQNPQFDADIVMPGDVTVECDNVPAPFVLTTADVFDNCTPSNLLVITFTQVRTDGNCKFNYVLTRTWKVTDQAGNMLIHTQKVTVRDTKAPTAICKNATVTLDKFGNATVTPGQVNNGSFDNCSAQADLTLTVTPSAFTCANLGNNVVTLTVTDECGNSATCTAIVTVQEGIGPCTPQISVKTVCKDNATTLDNGQFEDVITVKSLAMQTWTVTSNTGLYAATSPAPPAAPTPLPNNAAFTMGTADGIDNDGDGQTDEADEMVYYTLKGVHVEAIGYSIQIRNNLNQTGTISNKGYYPNPYFINLNDPFCLNTPPFTIQVGEYNNAQGTVENIMVNGVLTNTFNAAALGIGFHTVMATFNAGTPTTNLVINGQLVGGTDAQAQADPGCKQKITKIVQITDTPPVVVCNDLVHISISNNGGDCVFVVEPDDVLEGSYGCFDDYSVVITYPNGTTSFNPPNRVNNTHIGKTMKYTLVHAISGNVCWGNLKVEDKEPPILTCPADITIKCSDPTNVNFTGKVLVSDCQNYTIVDTDDYTDFGSCSDPRAQIIRTWLVTDLSGNQSTCSQKITISPFDLDDVVFPADVTIQCDAVGSTDPNVTGVPTINGSPIGTGGLCMASISKTDEYYDICPGSYEIIRTWKVRNMCLPIGAGNPVEHVQVIKIIDTKGPQFDCPADVTVSTDAFACCATAPLPDVIITEACSHVTSLTYKIVGIDENTGNLVIHEGFGGLANFPGNNLWHPDTLGVFGFSQCLPRGVYTVTYTAEDGCGNISNCTFKLTVEDQIPPISACDEFTQVALGGDGMAFVNASTFDDGSYDVCNPVYFKARRMNPNDCQVDTFFYDQVKFCCSDINDTVTVVFRVYDVQVQPGVVGLDEYAGHWNDCMVQVFVEDKIKPTCVAPANVTVTCENFDPSLWAYGFATSADNCCLDTITETRNLSLFDTVCNKGTITRTFRAIDCGGQSSTCTQRVFVSYEQDYFVRFPNDVIVTVCDGTGNYGEPTFFGEDCEQLGVSFEDEVFTVVPDACYKIERTWTIINWCTYNPNAGCIEVPNPNPNPSVNHPSNLPGPTVSAPGTPAPWAPTVVAIAPGQTPTNYSTFWNANANCYKYKQIIKVIDTQDPVVENCPASPVEVCDVTPNDPQMWNEMYWYDGTIDSHDLCEAPTDLSITATDLCSGAAINVRYLLFLDLDGDGNMETVINSVNTGIAGLGWNAVPFGNAANPNYGGGTIRQFDGRPVLPNQKYGFAIQTTVSGTKKTASVRWNTQQAQGNYVIPELPYGTHKIKWFVEDGCGNETICEYTFVVKDCKKPTVVCLNGLSVNIMPTKMITLWASDFLQYTEDNCTPSGKLVIGIRKSGTGTGFPLNPDGTPQTSVTFTCDELGTQLVELWSRDLAGNADYCETYVIVQDNAGICSGNSGTVAGALKTEAQNGLEEANVGLDGSHPALPPTNMFDFSDNQGNYAFHGVPFLGDYTVTPTKDNDPLNGVSTFDLVLINKHILGLEPLNSPYKMIAADANNSRSITTFDIVELRKLILGIYNELPNNTSWRFVDGAYNFPNQANPFQEIFPETKQIADMQASMLDQDFVSVKVGDVNGNAVTSSLTNVQDRTDGTLLFDVMDRKVKAGETFTVNFKAAERVMGYQFTLYFPNLEVVDVTAGTEMSMTNFGIFNNEHSLTTSFDNENTVGEFAVTFRAKAAGSLSEMLTVSGRITMAEAYDLSRQRQAIGLRFNGQNGSTITGLGFELYQNQPNPWMNKTQIGFHLPEAAEATLTIFDETGRMLFTQTGDFAKGYNAISLERSLINTTGVLYYKLETATDSAVKKMIQTK